MVRCPSTTGPRSDTPDRSRWVPANMRLLLQRRLRRDFTHPLGRFGSGAFAPSERVGLCGMLSAS